MFKSLLQKFVEDLTVEGVKLQLQLSVPHPTNQRNAVLKNVDIKELDGVLLMDIFRKEFATIRKCSSLQDFDEIVKQWHREHINAQYNSYWTVEQMTKVCCYVFLLRVLRKRHKKLHKMFTGR